MALFQGEDMVDVTTPDGRTLSLPRSIVPASMLPQQQLGTAPIAQPPVMPEIAPTIPALPQPVTTGLPGSDTAQPGWSNDQPGAVDQPVPQNGADFVVPAMTQDQIKKEQKSRKAEDAQAAKKVAYNATPAGQAKAAQASLAGGASLEEQGIRSKADMDYAEQTVLGDALAERNTQIDKLMAKRAADMQDAVAQEDAKYAEVTSLKNKIANTKIDRSADHPIIAALAIALAGYGSALRGDTVNPAMVALDKAIDRKVAGQMADLDQMGKIYGMTKEEVAVLKDKSKSRLEFHNAMIAGETEKAIRSIEELTARSNSDKTKANAQIAIGQLRQKVADKTLEAAHWGMTFDQTGAHQRASIGAQYAGIAESKRHNMASEQLTREGQYLDYQKALAADRARGDMATFAARQAANKDVRETGLKGLDGYLLTPEGRAKMTQAAQYELEAKTLEEKYKNDPMGASVKGQRIELLRQKAAELRGDANSFNVIQARDVAVAGKISDQYAASQTMMDTVDEIKMLYDQAGRGFISKTKLQQELQAKMGLLAVSAKDAWQLGAWDKGSAKLVADIIGADPTQGWDVGVISSKLGIQVGNDPEGFKNRLDAVTTKLEQDVRQKMKDQSNWDGKGELFTRKKAADMNSPVEKASSAITQARSQTEIANNTPEVTADLLQGPAAAALRDVPGSLKYPGVGSDQEAPFDVMLKAYKSGDKTAEDLIIQKIAQGTPDLAVPLLHALQDNAPKLYKAARAAVPPGSETDARLTAEASSRIASAPLPTFDLTNMIISTMSKDGLVTDEHDYQEIARRAGAGDPEARKAIMDIQTASSTRKSPSVYGGGR